MSRQITVGEIVGQIESVSESGRATARRPGKGPESPGFDSPGQGGDRENGDGGGDRYESGPPIENAKLGMWVLLCSLAMLFLGFTSAYVVLRFGASTWPPPGLPPLPGWLWANTAAIVLSGISMYSANASLKRGDLRGLKWWLIVTAALGVIFLALQIYVWRLLVEQGLSMNGSIYASIFYALTGLHGAHVVGGVVLLLYVLLAALRNRYSADRRTGVEVCGMYWHFVGGVWIFLFVVLYILD
ncbi:MAG: cytochrome c oxidase subunit 3 [Planctomycetota bacterium]|nr:cytochrome c oxidase subunit 3 [Planctomycetota bacterium]